MTAPSVSALPTAPNRASPGATFADQADAFVAALSTLRAEINSAITFMNNALTGSIGEDAAATVLTLMSNMDQIGFFTNGADTAMADLPGAYSAMPALEMRGSVAGNRAQLAVRASHDVEAQAWIRAGYSNNFGAWGRLVHLRNLLGTVSQSGGVPTGAVIERGSNANGAYVRLADGTQICTHSIAIGASTTAVGSEFMEAASVSWTYPAAFYAGTSPALGGNTGGALRTVHMAGVSATAGAYRSRSATSDATTPTATLSAIGKWF